MGCYIRYFGHDIFTACVDGIVCREGKRMWNDKESLTPELFCKEIERIYRDLREHIPRTGIELPENVRITRSRSHTASSQCEDLLAVFIAQRVEAGSCVHIDQGLSATLGGGKENQYQRPY